MPGTITPLPVMLLEEEDRKIYENLEPPKSIVCRFGYMKQVAELPYSGDDKPGCGSKLVIRSRRGIELAEMLTTTCANSGCGKSVSRKEMLEYIENSGGKDYPFSTEGRVLRIATVEDMGDQARLDERKPQMIQFTKSIVREMDLPMRLVDVEMLLGGERIIFHYTAEQWVDFRELVRRLAQEYQTRVEMHQVNARDEARLVADYEKCGQYCCCKQFLKVLKPVSMKSAKVQKATLDPAKISGRCGRLMCCLRYEDETYTDLKKRLPNKASFVKTEDGNGVVVDSQILTQLVLVRIDGSGQTQAYPVENIEVLARDVRQAEKEGLRLPEVELDRAPRGPRTHSAPPPPKPRAKVEPVEADEDALTDAPAESLAEPSSVEGPPEGGTEGTEPRAEGEGGKRRRRRRRRGGRGRRRVEGEGGGGPEGSPGGSEPPSPPAE